MENENQNIEVHLNMGYVLAPLIIQLKACRDFVYHGRRMTFAIDKMPDKIPEELKLMGIQFGEEPNDIEKYRTIFNDWITEKAFQDMVEGLRISYFRLHQFIAISKLMGTTITQDIYDDTLKTVKVKERTGMKKLIELLDETTKKSLISIDMAKSFYEARNCLSHNHGIVSKEFVNSSDDKNLIIKGRRLFLGYQKGDQVTEAPIGSDNSDKKQFAGLGLSVSSEDFELSFAIGDKIEMNVKQFADILSTYQIIIADFDVCLNNLINKRSN